MTIYFDGLHLATDSNIEELHAFAQKLGFPREWFQRPDDHPHYDVWGAKKKRVVELGAQRVDAKTLVERCYPERIAMLKRLMSESTEF